MMCDDPTESSFGLIPLFFNQGLFLSRRSLCPIFKQISFLLQRHYSGSREVISRGHCTIMDSIFLLFRNKGITSTNAVATRPKTYMATNISPQRAMLRYVFLCSFLYLFVFSSLLFCIFFYSILYVLLFVSIFLYFRVLSCIFVYLLVSSYIFLIFCIFFSFLLFSYFVLCFLLFTWYFFGFYFIFLYFYIFQCFLVCLFCIFFFFCIFLYFLKFLGFSSNFFSSLFFLYFLLFSSIFLHRFKGTSTLVECRSSNSLNIERQVHHFPPLCFTGHICTSTTRTLTFLTNISWVLAHISLVLLLIFYRFRGVFQFLGMFFWALASFKNLDFFRSENRN